MEGVSDEWLTRHTQLTLSTLEAGFMEFNAASLPYATCMTETSFIASPTQNTSTSLP